MIFKETTLKDAYIIDIEKNEDSRGFFARSWCRNEFLEHNLDIESAQYSISFNHKKGTLRGMHFQVPPFDETKVVRCTMGKIWDVIIDVRPDSETYKNHFSVELSSQNRRMLYIPKGFAHGFYVVSHKADVFYKTTDFYMPENERAVRWDDPDLAIDWPLIEGKAPGLSPKDRAAAAFKDAEYFE